MVEAERKSGGPSVECCSVGHCPECGGGKNLGHMAHCSFLLKNMLGNDKKDRRAALCTVVFMVLFIAVNAFLLAIIVCASKETRALRVEAVKRGFAEYRVDDEGRTEWHWRENLEAKQ